MLHLHSKPASASAEIWLNNFHISSAANAVAVSDDVASTADGEGACNEMSLKKIVLSLDSSKVGF